MITQRRQTYASYVDFDSFIVFTLKPKNRPDRPGRFLGFRPTQNIVLSIR